MANTTDFIITRPEDDEAINSFSSVTGIKFLKIKKPEMCGGTHIVNFDSYAACYRSLGKNKIDSVVAKFKGFNFSYKSQTVLLVDDDSDDFEILIVRSSKLS